jgi:hypothetical protein
MGKENVSRPIRITVTYELQAGLRRCRAEPGDCICKVRLLVRRPFCLL